MSRPRGGSASFAIPVLLFVICFPEFAISLAFVGGVILILFAIAMMFNRSDR